MNIKYIDRQEYRKIMLNVMSEIDRVCTKYNITYTIGGGTLLGAIRHKGFIPWDDDIDIFLERNDYEKLIALLKNSDCKWLSIVDDTTPGYYYPFAKAVDNRTVVKMESSVIQHGIWVDIFPMENVPDTKMARILFLKFCKMYRAILLSMTTDFSTQKTCGKTVLKSVLSLFARLVGRSNIYTIAKKYMQKHNNVQHKCECITWSPYGTEYIEKELMQNITEYIFEDRKFKGISNYDILLKRAFGDYLQLPPENKRRSHEVVAWYAC